MRWKGISFLSLGIAAAAEPAPAAANGELPQTQKKTRGDPCADLAHEKKKSGDKKAAAPTTKPAETAKP